MHSPRYRYLLPLAMALVFAVALGASAQEVDPKSANEANDLDPVLSLLRLMSGVEEAQQRAFRDLEAHWSEALTPMLLEVVHLARDPAVRPRVIRILERRTGQRHGGDLDAWYQWLWAREPRQHPRYADFKSLQLDRS